jgi:hypothetical protein
MPCSRSKGCIRWRGCGIDLKGADEKRPSAALASSFVNGVPSRYALFLSISAALHLDIFDQPDLLAKM